MDDAIINPLDPSTMNSAGILKSLLSKNIITGNQAQNIENELVTRPFSVHHELRSVLYLGIVLFVSGTGVVIYENIDTIGHQIVITLIALITFACFYYVFKNIQPFTRNQVSLSDNLSSYALLLGCMMFLILEGYVQYQYQIFGTKYGLAVFLPTLVFFYFAYRFDHTAVLSMAITGLACWLGLAIAPFSIISENDFLDPNLVITAVILGICLIVFGQISVHQKLKIHFAFTYFFLGGNLASVAAIAGLFHHEYKPFYFLAGMLLSIFFVIRARQSQSLVFLLMGVIYAYIILTYSLFTLMSNVLAGAWVIYYFLFSSFGVIFFLLNFKKILGIRK